MDLIIANMKRWIRHTIKHKYFPDIWYAAENWLFTIDNTGKDLLEIGCGKGLFTRALTKIDRNITCIDPSPESIAYAHHAAGDEAQTITFQQQNPEQLEFEDNHFDSIMCINMLEFSLDAAQVLDEMHRVLKPDGKAIVVMFRSGTCWSLPFVANSIRKDSGPRPFTCLRRSQFKKLIHNSKFKIDSIKTRVNYIPFSPFGINIPWPVRGAMVALIEKKNDEENHAKDHTDSSSNG